MRIPVLTWKFLEMVWRLCATLSAIACMCQNLCIKRDTFYVIRYIIMCFWCICYSHTRSKCVEMIKSDTFYVIHYITLYYIIYLTHTLHSRTHCSIFGTHLSYLMHTPHRCAHAWWNNLFSCTCMYMYTGYLHASIYTAARIDIWYIRIIFGTYVSYLVHTIHRCAQIWWNTFVYVYMYIWYLHTSIHTAARVDIWIWMKRLSLRLQHTPLPLSPQRFDLCVYICVCIHINVYVYICMDGNACSIPREVGGWGRDPKKCTGRDWGMGSSTI